MSESETESNSCSETLTTLLQDSCRVPPLENLCSDSEVAEVTKLAELVKLYWCTGGDGGGDDGEGGGS